MTLQDLTGAVVHEARYVTPAARWLEIELRTTEGRFVCLTVREDHATFFDDNIQGFQIFERSSPGDEGSDREG